MILNEEYRTLLLNENIIKDTLKDLKVNTGILFTFGTGMGALLPPVDRLLSVSGFQFNQQEISLLIITSIAILLNDTNKDKLLSTIKDLNLSNALDGVLEFIKTVTEIIRTTFKNLLGISISLSDVLGFALLLNPVMKIITTIINDRNITTDSINVLVSGVVLSGIVFAIKNLLLKLKGSLTNKKDSLKEDVEPSDRAIKNICDAKKFCQAQGKITFGQLRELVESAKTKRLYLHVGEGGFKALLRLMPWFFPQLSIAGFTGSLVRAINKVFKPTLEETENYKTWWGKVVLKIFKLVEGELSIDDPLSRIFFVTDGLMIMLDDREKVKFARHISELASQKPDDEVVPEFFVENELRNYLNQKFLLDPPLQLKGQTKTSLDEQRIISEGFVKLSEDNIDNLLGYLYEMGFDNDDAMYELNNLIDFYDNLPKTITLYRVVFADSDESIDKVYPGNHYSMNKKELIKNHYGSLRDSSYGNNAYLIKIKSQKQLIDVYESIKNNILYPNEQEVTLMNKGFGAVILNVGPVYS